MCGAITPFWDRPELTKGDLIHHRVCVSNTWEL